MAEQAPEGTGTQEDRISRVEAAVNRLAEKVSALIPTSHAEAEERTERRLDRPSAAEMSVGEQIEAAKRQAKKELKAEQDAAAVKSELDDHRKQLAAMREKPPAEAVDWRAKWWS